MKQRVVDSVQVNKMIRRCAEVGDSPERKLWREVLCQAVTDSFANAIPIDARLSARRFFDQVGFELVCDAAGIDFEFCRGLIKKLGQPIEKHRDLEAA